MAVNMAAPDNHPLPPPPSQQQYQQQQANYLSQQPPQQYQQQSYQQQPQHRRYPGQQPPPPPSASQRPTSHTKNRSFSFRSDKSHKSSGSQHKIDLHETSAEKESKRLHSKADPTLAMNEAEPSTVQAKERTSLAPLRSIQHRDALGNPISEPDRSNPTRSRWERPLDTIRSFEAAIDGGYNRKSYIRSDSESTMNGYGSRRNSYYGNNGPRFPNDSYYGGRPQSFRPDSHHYEVKQPGRDGYMDSHYGGYGPGPSRQRAPRMYSEPHLNAYRGGEQNVYPLPHKDRSYETVTSAAGSGNSDPAGYQTDPTSSDNSSIDRNSPAKRPEPQNDYGIGFAQGATYQPPTFNFGVKKAPNGGGLNAAQYQRVPVGGHVGGAPPPPPPKTGGLLRRQPSQQQPEVTDKRKSWFARRFSKAS